VLSFEITLFLDLEGGLGFLTLNSDIVIQNCQFDGENSATSLGGAISVENSNSNLTVSNVSFLADEASLGGGISLLVSNREFLVRNCNFTNNFGLENGGGLAIIMLNHGVKIEDSIFSFNFASIFGGGLFISQSNDNILIKLSVS